MNNYLVTDSLPKVLKLFKEICDTPTSIVHLRDERYENSKLYAEELHKQLFNEGSSTSSIKNVLKEVSQKLWEILFGFDHLAQSSVRQRNIARHQTEYKLSQSPLDCWQDFLLQKIIPAVYENINEFRSTSVRDALEIADKYQGETVSKTVLTSSHESVVAHVAGYVCRKTKDKLQRYCSANELPASCKVQENCARLGKIVETFGEHLQHIEKLTPCLSYPNLITLILNRGGLSTVDLLINDHIST